MTQAFPDWQSFVQSLQLDPTAYGDLQGQANTAAKLSTSSALANLAQNRASALRQYQYNTSQIQPQYDALVQQQSTDLAKQLATNAAAQAQTNQTYNTSSQNLSDNLKNQMASTEQDMARRGLWQSGVLNGANENLQGKYLTDQGTLENSRSNALANAEAQATAAQTQATFNVSAAQKSRVAQLQALLNSYQGVVTDANAKQQALSEQQGLDAQNVYNQLVQQLYTNALNARKQGLAEDQFNSNAYWLQQNANLAASQRKAQGLNY